MSLILDGTSGLSDVDGSAATPAIRGTDANTGMFFPAADTIAFSEGGVESMRLNSSGVLVTTNDASISGLTVGKGGGSVASNTAFGSGALAANTTGTGLTAVGVNAAAATSTNTQITAIGSGALATTTGSFNTAVGFNSSNLVSTGTRNTSIGASALSATSAATGSNNTAVGTISLTANTTGSNNTAMGDGSLQANTTASNNTAVGYQAGYSNTTGQFNTFVGGNAGDALTTGQKNTFIGRDAGGAATTGNDNTFVGIESGQLITTGSKNTILGAYNGNLGGLDIRTASNYIVLSDGDGNPRMYCADNGSWTIESRGNQTPLNSVSYSATFTGNIGFYQADRNTTNNTFYAISYYNAGTAAYRFRVADSGNVTNTNNSYGAISDVKLKENIVDATPKLEDLCKVKVRQYNLKSDPDHKQIGVVAQELEEVFAGLVDETKDTDGEGNDLGTTTKQVKYSVFVPMLIKALQELNAKVEAQALEIAQLKGN